MNTRNCIKWSLYLLMRPIEWICGMTQGLFLLTISINLNSLNIIEFYGGGAQNFLFLAFIEIKVCMWNFLHLEVLPQIYNPIFSTCKPLGPFYFCIVLHDECLDVTRYINLEYVVWGNDVLLFSFLQFIFNVDWGLITFSNSTSHIGLWLGHLSIQENELFHIHLFFLSTFT